MPLTLTSPAFADHGEIPSRHTCEGEDRSPPLSWSGVPPGAQSLALVVDDPDAPDPAAPKMTWVHQLLYELPAKNAGLPDAVAPAALPAGMRAGLNDWWSEGWAGPCPPIGQHRHFFKLYALDCRLGDLLRPDKARLMQAIEGHVLAAAELVGTYRKRGQENRRTRPGPEPVVASVDLRPAAAAPCATSSAGSPGSPIPSAISQTPIFAARRLMGNGNCASECRCSEIMLGRKSPSSADANHVEPVPLGSGSRPEAVAQIGVCGWLIHRYCCQCNGMVGR